MDTTQVLLIVVITVLTILLTIIGIQIVAILKEIKKTLQKANRMMDDAGHVTRSISQSVTGMSGMVEGIKAGLSLVHLFSKKDHEGK